MSTFDEGSDLWQEWAEQTLKDVVDLPELMWSSIETQNVFAVNTLKGLDW